jgi:hypothetical protein
VGTHADLVKKGELANLVKEMETLYPIPTKSTRSQIQGHFAVTLVGANKTLLMQLKNKLVELALYHPKIGVGHVRVPYSLHDIGLVVWHNVTRLRDVVVIDPQWLADALAGVVSFICQSSVARAGGMTNWSKMQQPLKLK